MLPEPGDLKLTAGLRALAAEHPDPHTVANRALRRYRSERPARGMGLHRPLAAVAILGLAIVALSYFAPVVDIAIADAPVTSTILRSAGLEHVTDRVSG